jgi:hypothetical protein
MDENLKFEWNWKNDEILLVDYNDNQLHRWISSKW